MLCAVSLLCRLSDSDVIRKKERKDVKTWK